MAGDPDPLAVELAAVIERVSLHLEEVIEALERDGLAYARAYATRFLSEKPLRVPRGRLRPELTKMIRELVLEELQTGRRG